MAHAELTELYEFHHDFTCAGRNELGQFTLSLAECAAKCEEFPTCISFDFQAIADWASTSTYPCLLSETCTKELATTHVGYSLVVKLPRCDASIPPANGGVGDCTNSLASGSTCQPTCDPGYTVSGTSSCTAGTLTAAACSLTFHPCNASSVQPPRHVDILVGSVGNCTGMLEHGSTCTIMCNVAEGYYVTGPATCNNGTFIGGVKCLCTKGHPRPWHGTLACQKRMRGIHVPGTFHDEL